MKIGDTVRINIKKHLDFGKRTGKTGKIIKKNNFPILFDWWVEMIETGERLKFAESELNVIESELEVINEN